MQRRVDVLQVSQFAILQGVAATPITFLRDAEVEDQASVASLVSEVVPKLHVAAPLARAYRDSMLVAARVSSRAEERGKEPNINLLS